MLMNGIVPAPDSLTFERSAAIIFEEAMKRALITGVAGFAGSHLADHLRAIGQYDVFGIVQSPEDAAAAPISPDRAIIADLIDPVATRKAIERCEPELVFHLAAMAWSAASWNDPWGVMENNVRAQTNILEALTVVAPQARLLIVSSAEVYGKLKPNEIPVGEETPLRPATPYAASKVAQEMMGIAFAEAKGLEIIRVRPFNHIGPRQKPGFVATDFAKQIASAELGLKPPIIRVGNLDVERDFTDVRDIAKAYRLIIEEGQPGDVYNIGSGRAISVQKILDGLLRAAQIEIEVEKDPALQRPAETPRVVANISRMRAVTSWSPERDLMQTLAEVMDDWRDRLQEKTRVAT